MLAGRCGLAGPPPKPNCRTAIPGRPSSRRSRATGGVITPRSSTISGSGPSSASAARNTGVAGAALPEPRDGGLGALRNRPVGDEAAEVVDPHQVDELEATPEALRPPAIPAPLQRRPVIERIPPELARGAERVGRRAGDETPPEELRMERVVGAARARRRSAGRRSAARRAPRRTGGAHPIRARSAPARRRRRRPRTGPSRRPSTGGAGRTSSSSAGPTGASGSASSPLHAAKADGDMYGEPVSSGGPSGRICHHDWPAAASQSTNANADGPSRPPGSEVGWRSTPLLRPVASMRFISAGSRPRGKDEAVPVPSARPSRVEIQHVRPEIDCGRFPAKRTLGDEVTVTATIFADGHDVLRAALRVRPPGARRWEETPLEPLGNDLWQATFEADRLGVWQYTIVAWIDRLASWRWELERKAQAGQADLSSELSEGGAPRRAAVADPRGGARPRPRRGRSRDAARGTGACAAARARRRTGAGAVRRLVRAVPAIVRRLRRCRRGAAAARRARLRRRLPAAHPSDRPYPSQGPEQRADRRPGRSGQPVGDRRRRRRPHRRAPRARNARRLRSARRARARARARPGARLRDPVLAGPPVARRAPGVVPPPAGRDAEVRREPAEALPGHLQRQLRDRGLAGTLGGAPGRRALLGRATACGRSGSTTRTRSRSRSGSG